MIIALTLRQVLQDLYDYQNKTGHKAMAIYLGYDTRTRLLQAPGIRDYLVMQPTAIARPEINGVPIFRVDEAEHYGIG